MKKVALVTGSSRGIGFGILRMFAENGYDVIMSSSSGEEKAKDNLDILRALGGKVAYVRCNLSDAEDRRGTVDFVQKEFGRLDVLVNNAGVAPRERRNILEMTEESFDYVVGTNLKGTMFMTQYVANKMLKQPMKGPKRATIVNITSSSVTVSSTNRSEYCMAKAGLAAMSVAYADRLAKERILVYEIRPGVIETDMTKVVHDKYSRLIDEGIFPIARWGTPEDLGLAVSAFCDDKFIYTTGNYVDVDGAFHIKRL